MVTITIPTDKIKDALIEATRVLILEMGETVTYKFYDGTPDETFRAVRQKLSGDDLVGDFKQGDCKFTIDATTLSKPPSKYDEIIGGDGFTYLLIDYLSVDVGIDNTTLVYKPVGRA